MKITVTGTRGIPDIQGGVETHCQELMPRLAKLGHDVTLMRRSCYVTDSRHEYKGVALVDVYAPRLKSLEAIVHTFLSVLRARLNGSKAVHIHAVGPAIITPLARLLGLKVVMTHHGPDYERKKWGRLARWVLKTGERWGVKYSSRVIVISDVIRKHIENKYGRKDLSLIFNGVNRQEKSKSTDYIDSLGLTSGKYIVALGRFVPEKGFHDLVEAFSIIKDDFPDMKLVIAGDADHPDEYSVSLKRKAGESGTVLTGFIKGEKLNQIMSNAALFVLPSYHEGLPIALLEAMSYDLDVLTSDIPANCIDELSDDDHFPVGNVPVLANALRRKLTRPTSPRFHDLSRYDWDEIARQTSAVYNSL